MYFWRISSRRFEHVAHQDRLVEVFLTNNKHKTRSKNKIKKNHNEFFGREYISQRF
jgi:hypothetical protein